MARFPCPYLQAEVELTEERERHIAEHHPDLLPAHRQCIIDTVGDPDQVRRSPRMASARMFTRQWDEVKGGKHVVVVIVGEAGPEGRYWIITAYIAREPAAGEVEWTKR